MFLIMTFYDNLSFLIRAKNRKAVFLALEEPKTPTQLSKELDINIGFISNILIELKERELIICLSPNEKRHRFYQISKESLKLLKTIKKETST